jgi:hypothetical protein
VNTLEGFTPVPGSGVSWRTKCDAEVSRCWVSSPARRSLLSPVAQACGMALTCGGDSDAEHGGAHHRVVGDQVMALPRGRCAARGTGARTTAQGVMDWR